MTGAGPGAGTPPSVGAPASPPSAQLSPAGSASWRWDHEAAPDTGAGGGLQQRLQGWCRVRVQSVREEPIAWFRSSCLGVLPALESGFWAGHTWDFPSLPPPPAPSSLQGPTASSWWTPVARSFSERLLSVVRDPAHSPGPRLWNRESCSGQGSLHHSRSCPKSWIL